MQVAYTGSVKEVRLKSIEQGDKCLLFIISVNKIGPSIESCGTPKEMVFFGDIFSGILTDCG